MGSEGTIKTSGSSMGAYFRCRRGVAGRAVTFRSVSGGCSGRSALGKAR
jgi:hypothetical protein